MFLVGLFSTHIGIAILWLAYLIGVASYSFGLFGSDAVETTDAITQNVIEYTQKVSAKVENSTTYYFQNSDSHNNDVTANSILKPISNRFTHTIYLGNITQFITVALFNQFTHSFRFSRPPPVL